MQTGVIPIFLFLLLAAALPIGLLLAGRLLGPRRDSRVKQMPYESGMDPIHGTNRRFDIRFHLVAIAFLVFDVELLFLYPWTVAAKRGATDAAGNPLGIDAAVANGLVSSRGLVFVEVMVFFLLLVIAFIYTWRKGLYRWR